MKIIAKRGSIIDEKADAIVNPANSYGLMGGGVAFAIKSAGGAVIEAEAVQKAPIHVGNAVLTSAGLLPFRFIIHTPTMSAPAQAAAGENIRKAVFAALKAADDERLRVIAMPGMGTGVGGFEPIDAAKIMVEEIKKFKAAFLKEVILIDISEAMAKAFEDALKN